MFQLNYTFFFITSFWLLLLLFLFCFFFTFFLIYFFYFIFYFLYCSGFCHPLKWNSHGFTCVPHPDPPSHLPLHPIPLGLPSAPGPSACQEMSSFLGSHWNRYLSLLLWFHLFVNSSIFFFYHLLHATVCYLMNKTWVLTSKICGLWGKGEGAWEMQMKTQNWTGKFRILSSRTDCCPISSSKESIPALRIRKDLQRANIKVGPELGIKKLSRLDMSNTPSESSWV